MSDSSGTTHHPALHHLETEFNEHMQRFREGIEDTEKLLYWAQRVSVLTLGYIEDRRLVQLFTDPYLQNAVVLSQPAKPPYRKPEEVVKDSDKHFRIEMDAETFTPAFRQAYTSLKKHANEYIDTAASTWGGEGDPPALRPSIEELSDRQRRVLDDLLQDGGFADRDALTNWTRDVIAATRGDVTDDFILQLSSQVRDQYLTDALLGNVDLVEEKRIRFLQVVAAKTLLPRFNVAIRDLAQTAGEMADVGAKDDGTSVDV